MQPSINRRDFLKRTSTLTAGLATTFAMVHPSRAAKGPNEKVLVAVIGCNGRGKDHIAGYLALPSAEIAYICDVDRRALQKRKNLVSPTQKRQPKNAKKIPYILK